MTDDDFKIQIAKLLPDLASALNGANGDNLSSELGQMAMAITNAPDLSTALTAIQSDPQKLAAVKAFGISKASAQSPPAPGFTPAFVWVSPVLSGTVLIGFFIMLAVLLTRGDKVSNMKDIQNVLFTLLGALGAAFTQVVNYWLGSSKGSADKTNLLASQKQLS